METVGTVDSGIERQVYRFEFRGQAGEYFRIWIVNLILSILTLGVYSAWAKVRTRRYFYGSTFLDNTSFDYHADPIRILKGRLVFGVFLLCYYLGRIYWPLYVVAGLGLLLFPLFYVRGMIFNLSNTSYRGVRFGFERDYKGSYALFAKAALTAIFTLYLLFGLSLFWYEQFRATNSRFGRTPFTFDGEKWTFWRLYIKGVGLLLLGVAIFFLGILAMSFINNQLGGNKVFAGITIGILALGLYGWLGLVISTLHCNFANYVFHHLSLGSIKIRSRYVGLDLFLIYLGNFFACLLTLGLAYPWARVQIAQYRASTTALMARPEDLASFTQGANASGNAVGDQILDFWDLDIGF